MKSPRKIELLTCALLTVAATMLVEVGVFGQQASQAAAGQSAAQPNGVKPGAPGAAVPAQSDVKGRIIVNTNMVVLPVTVKDGSGELVADLHKDEFRVFEDNIEQSIDLFTSDAFPLSMVVLIDNDLKDKDGEAVQASLDSIVAGLSLDDEAFVCRFDQFFHEGKGFTADQDKLRTELKRTNLDTEPGVGRPGGPFNGPTINNHSVLDQTSKGAARDLITIKSQSTKALDDAIFNAAQLLRDRGRNRRKIILLISDGMNGGKKFNTNTYDNVVKVLLQDNITVFSVAVPSAYLDRKLSPLIKYANDSGGDIFHATKEHSLEEFYPRIAEEARYSYTLAYIPRGTDHGAEYHSVEVRVKREGLTIKTREGYYTGAITEGTPR